MLLGNTHADRAAVFRIPFCILDLLCCFKVKGLSCPHIVAIGIQAGGNATLFHSRDQAHIDLNSGQTKLLYKKSLLGIRMRRELGSSQIVDHLHIVKHHSGDIIRKRLHTNAAHRECLGRCPAFCLLDHLVQILNITKCRLRAAGTLLGIVQLQKCRVLGLYRIKAFRSHKVTTHNKLPAFRVRLNVLCRLVFHGVFAIGFHHLVKMAKVKPGIAPSVDTALHRLPKLVFAVVEPVNVFFLIFRHKALHQLIVQPCKRICHRCLAETLGIHKAKSAGCFKTVPSDQLVDLNHRLLTQFKIIQNTLLCHFVKHSVKGSALLAHKGKIQVHLIFAIGSHHAEHRLSVSISNNLRLRPCAKRSILVFEFLANIVDLLNAVQHFIHLSLCQPFAAYAFLQIILQGILAALSESAHRQHYGAGLCAVGHRIAVFVDSHTLLAGIQSILIVLRGL